MRSGIAEFSGSPLLELAQDLERLVELVLVLVEVDQRGRDLPIPGVRLGESAVERSASL